MTLRRWMAVVAGVAVVIPLWQAMQCDPGRRMANRAQCVNNLKQIALALHAYHDIHGRFPPAYVPGPDGRPWHSWRVLILPFLEQNALYRRYDFNEPWDGPNNRKLLPLMPQFFACPTHRLGSRTKPTGTSYVAVTGPGTFFPGAESVSFEGQPEGAGRAIAVVEYDRKEIPWTEPVDLDVRAMAFRVNTPKAYAPSSMHPGGANVAWADGAVSFVKESDPPARLKARSTIAGAAK